MGAIWTDEWTDGWMMDGSGGGEMSGLGNEWDRWVSGQRDDSVLGQMELEGGMNGWMGRWVAGMRGISRWMNERGWLGEFEETGVTGR